jgi:hypothetical protein
MSAQESHCVTLNDAYAALKDGSISWVASSRNRRNRTHRSKLGRTVFGSRVGDPVLHLHNYSGTHRRPTSRPARH